MTRILTPTALRDHPTAEAVSLAVIPAGSVIQVIGQSGAWLEVNVQQGKRQLSGFLQITSTNWQLN